MQVKVKAIIIIILVSFFLGSILSGGAVYLISSKASTADKADIAKADNTIKQLNTQITGLLETNRQLTTTNTDEQGLCKQITDLNRQALKGLDSGSIQK